MVDPKQSFRRVENRLPRVQTRRHGIAWIAAVAWIGLCLVGAERTFAATPLPMAASNVVLGSTATVQTYTIDLSTMPTRPVLVIEVTPPPTHSNMQLEIEATNWNAPIANWGACTSKVDPPIFSQPGPGAVTLTIELYWCGPYPAYWAGGTADIKVRATSFGFAGPPVRIAIAIHAETRPATSTLTQQVDTSLAPRVASLSPSKDTVLYEDDPSASNGLGPFLWAGSSDYFSLVTRHSLMAFDFQGAIPPTGIVDGADLRLGVTGFGDFGSGGLLTIHQLTTGFSVTWDEGDAFAPGDGYYGGMSSISAADWIHPTSGFQWDTPGGNPVGPSLVDTNIDQTGAWSFSSFDLTAAVQSMVSNNGAQHGFLMSTSGGPFFGSTEIQFASRENLTPHVQAPTLVVQYTPTEPFESGSIQTNAVSYINEGQNFRWIYDLDHDDIFVTNVGGVCEVVNTSNEFQLPYTYRYQGTPFTGIDCCAWRIDSQTGVVGTGQALFFHNLDASNPANMPPDSDQDGIRDLCDNCPNKANGPLRGTCLIGALGAACHSNQECGTGGRCNLSQEDSNGDFVGNVCVVPEPGFAVALAAGMALIATRARPRVRR